MVSMRCGSVTFAVPIGAVREIVMVPEITPVPETGPFVRGVINLRGRILPVLDLAPRLGLGEGPAPSHGRILVVEHDREHPVGLLVDDASEVLRVPEGAIAAPPQLAGGATSAVSGVARLPDRLLLVLDLDRVFGDPSALVPTLPASEAPAP
jgi:purine-binding chemotaxis protein CheW